MIRNIVLLFLLLSPVTLAEEVIAVVDLKFLKETGKVASTLCFEGGDIENDCTTWATFYLFEARVKKVVSGEPRARKFHVWFGRHALRKGNIKNMVAKLKPLPQENEVDYQVIEWGERKELYCFGADENESYNTNIELQGTNMQCYGYEAE